MGGEREKERGREMEWEIDQVGWREREGEREGGWEGEREREGDK